MSIRGSYIGGTDIVKLLGVTEFGNWTDVWKRFVYNEFVEIDPEEKRDLLRGKFLEPHIERYLRENIDPEINSEQVLSDFEIDEDQPFATDIHQPYLRGHIDGISHDTVYEYKAPRTYNLDRMNNYGVREDYIAQCQFYMMITGRPRGAVVLWDYDEWKANIIPVRRDEHIQSQMRAVTRHFWECVQSGETPNLIYQRKMSYLHLYDHDELDKEAAEMEAAREERKRLESVEKGIKPRLMSAINAVWQDGEKTCQFTTRAHTLRATRSMRGETEYVTLTVKANEIKKSVPFAGE